MVVIHSELTPAYHDGIDKVLPGSGGKRNRRRTASSKGPKTHLAGDRFRTPTMAVGNTEQARGVQE